jgi:hypothetical protein
MVVSPSSKVDNSALRNAREATLGVMFNLFPAWIWTLNDRFKFLLFIWPAHLPRKVDGNLYILLCVRGFYSGQVIFAILEYTMLFSSDSVPFS